MNLRAHAGWLLVALALLVALIVPTGAAGGLGAMIAIGAAGVLLARGWHRVPAGVRRPGPLVRDALVIALVATVGAGVCADALAPSAGWLRGGRPARVLAQPRARCRAGVARRAGADRVDAAARAQGVGGDVADDLRAAGVARG